MHAWVGILFAYASNESLNVCLSAIASRQFGSHTPRPRASRYGCRPRHSLNKLAESVRSCGGLGGAKGVGLSAGERLSDDRLDTVLSMSADQGMGIHRIASGD